LLISKKKQVAIKLTSLLKEDTAPNSEAQKYIDKLIDLASKGQFGNNDDLVDLDYSLRKAYRTHKRGLNPISPEKKAAAVAKASQTRKDDKLMMKASEMAAESMGLSSQERFKITLSGFAGPKGDKWHALTQKIYNQLKNAS
jgi:hypothetical protein